MKKFLSFVVVSLLYMGVQAQIVSSRSVSIQRESKVPSETMWYLRGGVNMMGFAGDGADGTDKKMGYNFVYGFQKPIGTIGTYWGMDFGVGSRGYKAEAGGYDMSLMAHNVQVSPFTFGWKYGLIDNVKLDIHAGAYAGFDYAGKIKLEDESISMGDWEDELDVEWKRFDAGLNVGFGVWYDRFNLDITFQRGFIEAATEAESYTSNLMIRLGIAF